MNKALNRLENIARAKRAEIALDSYMVALAQREDHVETTVAYLLTDLMHLSSFDSNSVNPKDAFDFDYALNRAREYFASEQRGEE